MGSMCLKESIQPTENSSLSDPASSNLPPEESPGLAVYSKHFQIGVALWHFRLHNQSLLRYPRSISPGPNNKSKITRPAATRPKTTRRAPAPPSPLTGRFVRRCCGERRNRSRPLLALRNKLNTSGCGGRPVDELYGHSEQSLPFIPPRAFRPVPAFRWRSEETRFPVGAFERSIKTVTAEINDSVLHPGTTEMSSLSEETSQKYLQQHQTEKEILMHHTPKCS